VGRNENLTFESWDEESYSGSFDSEVMRKGGGVKKEALYKWVGGGCPPDRMNHLTSRKKKR